MTKFYLRSLRSPRLHPLKTAHAPETPTIPSVAKRWRSGTLHLENPVQKRWRSDTLHPRLLFSDFTASLRPFRRLRDKQPDPSGVRVKRPRLAPAQVMSTALAKSCDWSLGVDERGTMFDKINKGWRHSIFLTGRAARKRCILLQSLRRISVCCLRPWHVNGRNGRSTKQHCL